MSFAPRDYLRHILDETSFLIEESRSLDVDRFAEDEIVRRAFVRSLEVIGEATKQLPLEFRSAYPDVDWSGMAKMRDRLIHGYFAVDYRLVWEVVTARVPVLHERIREILAER